MTRWLIAINAFVDRITNRSLESLLAQFTRTQSRLVALSQRRVREVHSLDAAASALMRRAHEANMEASRAQNIAERIGELIA